MREALTDMFICWCRRDRFSGQSPFQKFTIREQLTVGVNLGREGRGWSFSVVDFIDLSWPQTTTLVPSSSFYTDDKPSGVFAVLSFLPSTLLESTTGISFGSSSPLFRFVIYRWKILILDTYLYVFFLRRLAGI